MRLALSDRNLHLIDDHVDMAVRIGALADSALVATRVGAVRLVVCGSPAYFAGHGVPQRPEDLAQLAAVTFDPFTFSENWIFPGPKSNRELRVTVRSPLSVNTAEAAIDAAAAWRSASRAYCPIRSRKRRRTAKSRLSSPSMSLGRRVNLIHAVRD